MSGGGRRNIQGHIEQGEGARIIGRADQGGEDATGWRRAAQHAHEGQLVDDALLLRRLEHFAKADDDAGDASHDQDEEEYHAPEEEPGRGGGVVIPAFEAIASARLGVMQVRHGGGLTVCSRREERAAALISRSAAEGFPRRILL